MTEDEAKTKWCPQAEHRDWKCIASACMAWRWAEKPPEIERTIWPSNPAERRKMQAEEEARLAERFKRRKGFCGLAGRP